MDRLAGINSAPGPGHPDRTSAGADRIVFAGADQIPLTYGQHLLRFLETLHPGGAFGSHFSMMETYELRGPLDYSAFEWSLEKLAERHDALRSIIVDDGEGIPYQTFTGVTTPRLLVEDLPVRDASARIQVVEDFVNDVQRRDHPVEPPLIWAWLGRFTPEDHILVLVLHRSVSDAWSMEIAMRDLSVLYHAKVTGEKAGLEPLAMSYAEFANLEQAYDDSQLGPALAYWDEKLAGIDVPLLPTDRPRPRTPTEQKAHVLLPVGRELQADLIAFSRPRRLTLFMTVLAAFKAYLRCAARTDDVSVPTQTAGRSRVEIEETIGFFLNAQLLRTDLSGDPTLDELLSRVRTTCLGAYAHEVPILMLIDRMPELAAALADDRYILMPFQHVQIPLMADRSRRLGGECYYANFTRDPERAVLGIALPMDSLFTVRWVGDNMLVSINYSTDLFDEPTVEQMAADFLAILRQIVHDPSGRLSQLPLARAALGGAIG